MHWACLTLSNAKQRIKAWVSFLAFLDFIENLGRVIAAKHGQLPECPIPPIIVAWHVAIFPMYISHLQNTQSKH